MTRYNRTRVVDSTLSEEYYIVSSKALPEVFAKVVAAKRLLGTGAAHSASEAARLVGISRSAFYKYKDMVMPYDNAEESRVLTIQSMLKDQPGVLSSMITSFFDAGANILTVNQNIPANGAAYVTVSVSTGNMEISVPELFERLRALDGVISVSGIGVGV